MLEDSISSLEREIKEIDEVLAPRAKQESETRLERYLDCFELLKEEKGILEKLYEPLRTALLSSNETARKLMFISRTTFDITRHASRGMELLDRRKAVYREQEELEDALKSFFREIEDADFGRESTKQAIVALRDSFLVQGEKKFRIQDQLRRERTSKEFAHWLYSIDDFSVTYSIKFDGKDLQFLSPGEKGTFADLLRHAEALGANAILNTCYDDALDVETLFHGAAVVIELLVRRRRPQPVAGGDAGEKMPGHVAMNGGTA